MQYKQTLFKRTALSAAIIATLGLTACGGGGGSSSSDGDSTFSATSSGTAAKGIISGGIVTATEVTSGNEVGTAITDNEGKYQLTIGSNYQGGPVQLTINADADTQMKCDATDGCGTRADDIADTDTNIDFGEWYKPGEGGIQMRALLPSASNGAAISASITPFTEMAANRAEQDGISEDSIAAANSEVTSLLGVNILNTPPVDITALPADASATEIAYAALASAAANLSSIDPDTGVIDVQAGVDALASSLAAEGIVANDDDTDASVISLQDILDEANATLAAAGVEVQPIVVGDLETDVINAGEDGLVNPEPVDTATLSAVDKAKALVEDFRTYAVELDTNISNPEFGGAFAQQLELVSQIGTGNLETDPLAAFALVSDDVRDLAEFILDNYVDTSDSGTLTFPLPEDDAHLLNSPYTSGSMAYTININEETGVYEITADFNNAKVGPYTLNMDYVFSGTYISSGEDTYNEETGEGSGTYEETDDTNNSISGTMVSAFSDLSVNAGEISEKTENAESSYNNEQGSGTYNDVIVNQISANVVLEILNEGSDNPVVFTGDISANTMSKQSEEYSNNYDTNNYSNDEVSINYIKSLGLDGAVAYMGEEVALDVSVAMPNAEIFFAMDEAEETPEQWLEMNAGMGLTIDTASLSGVSLNLSATRTDFDAAEAEVRLSHNERSLLISFATSLTSDAEPGPFGSAMNLTAGEVSGNIQVTDTNGTTITITPPATDEAGVIGEVTVDGIVVATIEQTDDGLIKTSYTDGTFEIY